MRGLSKLFRKRRKTQQRPTAADLLDNYTIAEATEYLSTLNKDDKEKLVSEVWKLYHKRNSSAVQGA